MNRKTFVTEWRQGGYDSRVVNNQLLGLMLEEQSKLDGIHGVYSSFSDALLNSREIMCPVGIPAEIRRYWNWRPVLRDVANITNYHKPLDQFAFQRILFALTCEQRSPVYDGLMQDQVLMELCDRLGKNDEDAPYETGALFLCTVSKIIHGMPGPVDPAVRWYLNAYLCRCRVPPFIVRCEDSATYFSILEEVCDRPMQMVARKMWDFMIYEVEQCWGALERIAR